MGRPRKLPQDRLTRTITARVADDQYDWLVEDAIQFHGGDLSKALREAIRTAMSFERVLSNRDPHAALDDLIERGRAAEAREVGQSEDQGAVEQQ